MSRDFTRHIQYVCVMGESTAGSEVLENEYNLVCSLSLSLSLSPAPTTLSSLGGLCDFEQSMCGWTHDPMSELKWSLYSSSSPSLDLTLGSDSKSISIKYIT